MRTAPRALAAATLATLLAVATPALAAAQGPTRGDFDWSEAVRAGTWLRIRNWNGPVEVRAATGERAEVHGQAIGSSDRGTDVVYRVIRDDDGVTICAVPDRDDVECSARGIRGTSGGGRDWGRRPARARLLVSLPAGARIDASSGNGEVTVENVGASVVASSGNGRVRVAGASGPVRASSGNGDIDVSTAAGPVTASTGNGRIEARMLALREDGDMHFSTGNGAVTVWLPDDFGGDVSVSGQQGFETDFPIEVRSGDFHSRISGRVGRGGRRVDISTGNGSVSLRRAR
jgi:hypothetical protein